MSEEVLWVEDEGVGVLEAMMGNDRGCEENG
jgi:hypothetical protein